jgi:hypothetical protein
MKWAKWGLVVLVLVTAVVVFSNGFFQKKYNYYYYPRWNAYYDVRHKNYIYSIDGGKTWEVTASSSNGGMNTLGEKIGLRSDDDKIWLDNEEHRKEYDGKLSDLVSDFLEIVEEKKEVRKKNVEKDSTRHINKRDSLIKDSIQEMENWIQGTTKQDDTTTGKQIIEENKPVIIDPVSIIDTAVAQIN